MNKHLHRSARRRTRLGAVAIVLVAGAAASLALSVTSGGATSGSGSGVHSPVPSPVASPRASVPSNDADRLNPWTLNDPRYFSYLPAPAAPAPSNDLVIPDAERARLLALIEAGMPLTAGATTATQSGTGG